MNFAHINNKSLVRSTWNRIVDNVDSLNREYFESQYDVIEVYMMIIEFKDKVLRDSMFDKLLDLADELYIIDPIEGILEHNPEDYPVYDPMGGHTDPDVSYFVSLINHFNRVKYNQFIESSLLIYFDQENFIECSELMKKVKKKTDFMPNEYSKLFCKIFDDDINSEYWYLLVELVDLGYDSNSFNKIKKNVGLS